jgi:hypothetical protein
VKKDICCTLFHRNWAENTYCILLLDLLSKYWFNSWCCRSNLTPQLQKEGKAQHDTNNIISSCQNNKCLVKYSLLAMISEEQGHYQIQIKLQRQQIEWTNSCILTVMIFGHNDSHKMRVMSNTLIQLQNCSINKYAQNLLKYSNIKNVTWCSIISIYCSWVIS